MIIQFFHFAISFNAKPVTTPIPIPMIVPLNNPNPKIFNS